jgi:hypothetical protein
LRCFEFVAVALLQLLFRHHINSAPSGEKSGLIVSAGFSVSKSS